MGDYRERTDQAGSEALERTPLLDHPETPHSAIFRPPKFGALEFVLFTYIAALLTFHPILQQYLYNRILTEEKNITHGNTTEEFLFQTDGNFTEHCGENSSSEAEDRAQKQASQWAMATGLATTIPAIFSTILIGAYIDLKGRKPGLLLPVSGAMLKTVIYLLVIGLDWPLSILVVGSFLEGCSGFIGAMLAAVFSYMADITKPGKQRSFRITILQASVAIASAISNLGTGFFIKATGFFFPLLASLGLLVINIIIILVFIPESIVKRSSKSIFDCTTLRNSLKTYIKSRQGGKRWLLFALLFVAVLVEMAELGRMQVSVLFEMAFPFCWDSIKIGLYAFLSMFARIVAMVLLLRLFQRCIPDTVIAMLGIVSGIAEFLVLGLADTETMLYLSIVAGILFQFPMAMVKSVMSALVGPEEQGCLFAGVSLVQVITSGVGVLLFNPIYQATVAYMPGFVFLVIAGMLTFALLLLTTVATCGGIRHKQQAIIVEKEDSSRKEATATL